MLEISFLSHFSIFWGWMFFGVDKIVQIPLLKKNKINWGTKIEWLRTYDKRDDDIFLFETQFFIWALYTSIRSFFWCISTHSHPTVMKNVIFLLPRLSCFSNNHKIYENKPFNIEKKEKTICLYFYAVLVFFPTNRARVSVSVRPPTHTQIIFFFHLQNEITILTIFDPKKTPTFIHTATEIVFSFHFSVTIVIFCIDSSLCMPNDRSINEFLSFFSSFCRWYYTTYYSLWQ